MPEFNNLPQAVPVPNAEQQIQALNPEATQPKRTAADWVRDLELSAEVNKTTVGVASAKVTPELLLATSQKLLKLNKGEVDPDSKDSLEFQRVYGPAEYFAEHVLKDSGRLGRSLLWKATNKGSLDFMQPASLDKHISDVFYNSKLAQLVDGSSPLELADSSYKITRIGEGGVGDVGSAPDEMRLIQPSFLGYIDPVRCYSDDTELLTEAGWKEVTTITTDDKLACLIEGRLAYKNPTAIHSYAYVGDMYGYGDGYINYMVTPGHRMRVRPAHHANDNGGASWHFSIRDAAELPGLEPMVIGTSDHSPYVCENMEYPKEVFTTPPDATVLRHFATYLGWYMSCGYTSCNDGVCTISLSTSLMRDHDVYKVQRTLSHLPFKYNKDDITVEDKALYDYLQQFGKLESTRFVPDWLFTTTTATRRGFLQALFRGEGHGMVHYHTSSTRMRNGVERLCADISVTTRTEIDNSERWKIIITGKRTHKLTGGYYTQHYQGKVYCPTVPGGLVFCRRGIGCAGFWCGNSPESLRVGLDVYLTKHAKKGTDGKLYQTFINARTGKPELVDSVTASKSVVTTPDMMKGNTSHVYAVGGKTGARIVARKDVDYYLPDMDEAFSTASNLVTGFNGVKSMRLLMGCLHPATTLVTLNKRGFINFNSAASVNTSNGVIPGCSLEGKQTPQVIRATVSKLPRNRSCFRKIILLSGRVLITSDDHRWPVLRNDKLVMVKAGKLAVGDRVLRTTFSDLPARRTYLNDIQLNQDSGYLLGVITRDGKHEGKAITLSVTTAVMEQLLPAIERHGIKEYKRVDDGVSTTQLEIRDKWFVEWASGFITHEGCIEIPTEVLSANRVVLLGFINGYSANEHKVAMDSLDYVWMLELPNTKVRDELAFILARLGSDTLYRDARHKDDTPHIALKVVETPATFGDCFIDKVEDNKRAPTMPVMIDVDVNDNLFATANGIITHNSKYPIQALPISGREAPLVSGLDSASGKAMRSLVGKYLGAKYAKQGGVVTAVRKNAIDVIYDNGKKGRVALYENFPLNAKGHISNTAQVKAGQAFKAGDLLASSNYTDDKGDMATGVNLRTGWLSWKGGTYEDAVVLSETAAKKMSNTVMYTTDMELDKTVTLGKKNYSSWKPDTYTKEQLDLLDDDGIVKPGTVLRRGDPIMLAVRATQPSPGTMGRRVLTDMSETWEHDHPGIVTDIMRTKKGIKVLTTIESPAEIGDKVAGMYGNKGVIAKILPDSEMPQDKDGKPLEMLLSPLGLISRTNPAQLNEAMLGKIAKKTGKQETLPAFFDGDVHEYVKDRLKQARVSADDSFFDPETGKEIKNVVNGYSYIHKLKHLSESKMSARGTDSYTMDDTPGGSGYSGCFPAMQSVLTMHGQMSIATICEKRLPVSVLTYDKDAGWCYRQVTDWFTYRAQIEDILNIATEWNLSDAAGRSWVRHSTNMYPTRNHKLYRADMTEVLAGNVKEGDLLASFGYSPTTAQRQLVLGTMLGDAYIHQDGALSCEHSKSQIEWITWKHQALRSIGSSLPSKYYKVTTRNKEDVTKHNSLARMMRVPRSAFLAEVEHMMVKARRRVVTREVLDQLGELGFCVWFLDDGSIHDRRSKASVKHLPEAKLATNGFTPDEDRLIVSWLKDFLNLDKEPHLSRGDHNDGTEAYAVVFSRQASWKIVEMVARNIPWHVIPRSKKMLRKYCRETQEKRGELPKHDFTAKLGVVPVRVKTIKPYKHDKPGITELPVYDFTVEGTHKYTLPGGILVSNSKRFGTLEVGAMVGHRAMDNLLDQKLIRGQSNAEFWRSIRTGGIPTIPGEPLVQKKFFAHLQGSGVNVRKTREGISVFALSNSDVNELAGPREVRTRDTYDAKTFNRIDGGLFGQDVFGMNGDRWGFIQLDSPVPNPVMEEPLAKLLRISTKDFEGIVSGAKEVNGMSSAEDLKQRLSSIDLEKEAKQAHEEFKKSSPSTRDKALKRYVAVENMRRQGINPAEYMLDKIPVLPAQFRPVTTHNGMTMVADANYLYAQLMDARDDLRDAKTLPKEYQQDARRNLYRRWKELVGLYDPEDVKLQNKNVGGLLKWALGSRPKFSAFQRKVLGMSVDAVGRGVIIPNSRLKLDEVGLPVRMAMDMMAPFVERGLVKQGHTPIMAMKMRKSQDPRALQVLNEVIKTRPVELNRAPTLHKYGILALMPKLVKGNAINVHPSICPELAADFDGDSVNNRVRLLVDLEVVKNKYNISKGDDLNSLESGVYSSCAADAVFNDTTAEDIEMITAEQKVKFTHVNCSLEEVPVIEGSAVTKDNVVEWDVAPGYYFDTVDPATGHRVIAPLTKVSKHAGLKMFDCSLSTKGSFNHIVTASDDHSLITADPFSLALVKSRPEESIGRMVPRLLYNQANNNANCARTIKIGKVLNAGHDLGFILGVMLGDGWVDKVGCMRIACACPSLQAYLLSLLTCEKNLIPMVKDAQAWAYATTEDRFGKHDAERISVYATTEFKAALKAEIGAGANNKKIPSGCLMGSRAHLTGLLMGLLATDGTISYSTGSTTKKTAGKTVLYHTTSPQLRDGVQELCLRLGIRTGVTPYKGKHSIYTCYAISLSTEDLARAYNGAPHLFNTHHAKKQEALERIVAEVSETGARNSKELVPFPIGLRGLCIYAGVHNEVTDAFNNAVKTGRITRIKARQMLDIIDKFDVSAYTEPSTIPSKYRKQQTPAEVTEILERWRDIISNITITWECVDSVTPSTCTEGWDCTVPGPYTFVLSEGTVVQDTVNVHVPVSDRARQEAIDRMRPSRNLIAMSDRKIMNKPEKEYSQGLFIASRIGKNNTGRSYTFRNVDEAKQAWRSGAIDVDTPITIQER